MSVWLLSPLAWLLLSVAAGAWAGVARRPRLALSFAAVALLSVSLMTPLGSNLLLAPLERQASAPAWCDVEQPEWAVVLGGGVEGRPSSRDDPQVLNLASRRRMDRAIAWWRGSDGRQLLLQGGAPHPGAGSLAGRMGAYASAQGVRRSAVHLDAASSDTWESARHASRLTPQVPRRVMLVTSSMHMRRAREAFERAGFEVCPLVTDQRRLPYRVPWSLVPRTSGLENTELALHEWVGLLYYRVLAERDRPASAASAGH